MGEDSSEFKVNSAARANAAKMKMDMILIVVVLIIEELADCA
jgi:hypothetical protein